MLFLIILFSLIFSVTTTDLYDKNDSLTLFNFTNIKETLTRSSTAWIIQFYNSECGHCRHYAPSWKKFAMRVEGWSYILKVGAINCYDEINIDVCRDFKISSYPYIKLFPPHYSENDDKQNRTFKIKKRDPKIMIYTIVSFLKSRQGDGMLSSQRTNLVALTELPKSDLIFKQVSSDIKTAVFFLYKAKNLSLAMLDIGSYDSVLVRYGSDELMKGKSEVMLITRQGKSEKIALASNLSAEKLTNLVVQHLRLSLPKKISSEKDHGSHLSSKIPIIHDKKKEEEKVYMVDIENVIYYALHREVALHNEISGEKLVALKDFIRVLLKYLPARPLIHNYLSKLYDFLSNNSIVSLSYENYEKILNSSSSSDSFLPEGHSWKGCLGSEEKYRGYTCGLWTLFHTLTVNSFLRRTEYKMGYDPHETLRAIYGYIKYFFSCEHCSQHFQEMYISDGAETSVVEAGDEVYWLWAAHNKVNKRLKGDNTEDPWHPKQEFPPLDLCPSCWWRSSKGEGLDKINSFQFLVQFYRQDNISYEGVFSLPRVVTRKTIFHYTKETPQDIIQSVSLINRDVIYSRWNDNVPDTTLYFLLYLIVFLTVTFSILILRSPRKLRRRCFLFSF